MLRLHCFVSYETDTERSNTGTDHLWADIKFLYWASTFCLGFSQIFWVLFETPQAGEISSLKPATLSMTWWLVSNSIVKIPVTSLSQLSPSVAGSRGCCYLCLVLETTNNRWPGCSQAAATLDWLVHRRLWAVRPGNDCQSYINLFNSIRGEIWDTAEFLRRSYLTKSTSSPSAGLRSLINFRCYWLILPGHCLLARFLQTPRLPGLLPPPVLCPSTHLQLTPYICQAEKSRGTSPRHFK